MDDIQSSALSKKINIVGTNNRYLIKKVIREHKEQKKRVESGKWDFSQEYYNHDQQMKLLHIIKTNNYVFVDKITKIIIQQINKKILGYKQQDITKKIFDENNFIHLKVIIEAMIECDMKCRYCADEMSLLYELVREMKQWSVDRIDNDNGHNIGNYHLACLECNLKRRRTSDDKFLFTKQLNIVKNDH